MKKTVIRYIKSYFYKLGFQISRIKKHGLNKSDAFEMQKYLIGERDKLTIFDVGAYIGVTTAHYNQLFPNSKIYAFEPFIESYKKLQYNNLNFTNILSVNAALGHINGKLLFNSNLSAQTNSILKSNNQAEKIWGNGLLNTVEHVYINMITLDDFVIKNDIHRIDILKLDVQGAEFKVLEGAKETLEKGLIKMIYTEIIIMPTYEEQKYLDEVLTLFRINGFELFNIYNYSLTNFGQLRQVDVIFINKE